MGKLDDIISEIGSKYYPVGSVVITSTNVGATYMHNLYGGTWALKRKRFASYSTDEAITFNTTNTQSGASRISLYKDSILARITFAPKVAFADTALEIGTLDCTKIGIRQTSDIFTQNFMLASDNLNALFFIQLADGIFKNHDICTKTTATSVAASTSTATATFPIAFKGGPETMLDSFCDEFWWVRTA